MKKPKGKIERKKCLFCENFANSKEDTFPLWLLDAVGNRQDMRKVIAGLPTKIQRGSSVLRIRTVCETCNNGWMSRLEQDTIPVLKPLLADLSIRLSSEEQILLATWALNTGMVLDSIYKHNRYYQGDECKALHESRIIPAGTVIWIGRYFGSGLHAGLSDFSLDSLPQLKVAAGCVITFVLGHVAFQILSVRPRPEFKERSFNAEYRRGRWDELLAKIWPNAGGQITWPPPLSFTLYSEFSFVSLINRFKPTGV